MCGSAMYDCWLWGCTVFQMFWFKTLIRTYIYLLEYSTFVFNLFTVQSMDWLTNRWKYTQTIIWKLKIFVLPVDQSKACNFLFLALKKCFEDNSSSASLCLLYKSQDLYFRVLFTFKSISWVFFECRSMLKRI